MPLTLCTAAPPPLQKIGKELLSDFFEGRGGCTQANAPSQGISVKFSQWGLPGVRAFVAVPVEFSSVFRKQRHVALYSDKGALVLDTFTTYFGYLGRFRFIYNSPSSWSSRKDKSITKLQSATKFWRHCKQIGYLQRTKESTPLPPTLHSSSSSSSSLSSSRASLGIHESISPSITVLQQSREVV